jgi:L-alanine-DL-glutamate epimerase-like enolase superfamily enzyme
VFALPSGHGVIEGYRLTRFELPPPRLLGDSQVRIESHWIGSLELSSSSGHVGLGLFSALLSPLPPLAELERVFETTVARGLIGESPFALTNRLVRPRGGQIAGNIFAEAVDQALWDLQGKELALPLYRLLGGSANRVRAYASGLDFHLSTDESCAFFAAAAAEGFRAFKLKVGYPDLQWELGRLDAISRAVGPDAILMVDANEAWSPKEAILRAHAYRESGLNVYWLEDPCLRDDFQGLARVANETPFVRLNAGEYLDADGRHRLLEHRAVDVLNVSGDIGTAMQSARIAAHYGVPVSVGNSLGEISVHVAAALPEFTWIEYSSLGYERLLADPILPQEGYLVAPERPGHGLALSDRGREELASDD